MRPAVLEDAEAPRRASAAAYLLSSALVLAGGYVELYGGGPTASVAKALFGVAFYGALLVAALVYLVRVRGDRRDALVLFGILLAFLLDLPMLQQRFGWEEGAGRVVAAVGFASGFALVAAAALALRIPLSSRAMATLVSVMAFLRFGPTLLTDPDQQRWGVVPGFVFLGWALAACLLPLVLLPRAGGAPWLARLEEAVVGASLVAGIVHLLIAGISVDLPFRVVYLAPFVILLGPALRNAIPEEKLDPPRRLLLEGLPFVGLALSTLEISRELASLGAGSGGTLTPFNMALALTLLVVAARARATASPALRHAAAALLAVGILARNLDLPEALARVLYPSEWQVVLVGLAAWGTVFVMRDARRGAPLVLLAAVPAARPLEEAGYPWGASLLLVVGWSALVLREVTGFRAHRAARLGPALVLAVVPLAALAAERTGAALVVFALQCALGFALGRWIRDRALRVASLGALLAAAVGFLAAGIRIGPVDPATLLTRLGLAAFLLGVLNSLFGARLRAKAVALARAARETVVSAW